MPELPEVETIRNRFRRGADGVPSLLGRRILRAALLWERTLETPQPQVFLEKIRGQRVSEIGRRGKYLIFYLDADALVIHLRMSGDLWWEASETPPAPHHRLLLYFDAGRLAFNDARKFGSVWLLADPSALFARLGPEPLEERFTAEEFYRRLQARRRQIKPLLLDQKFLAGVGNIYADEALHRAGIHPQTRSDALTPAQAARLLGEVRRVLREGIERNGASIDWVYRGGDFQNSFRVYQRAGEPCYHCGTPIVRMVLGQRGTHFCPRCQPAPADAH